MQESLKLALQNAREWLESMEAEELVMEFEAIAGEGHGMSASDFSSQLESSVGWASMSEPEQQPHYVASFCLKDWDSIVYSYASRGSITAANDHNYSLAA